MALVMVTVIMATVALVALQGSLAESRNRFEVMRMQAAELESANQTLISNIEDLGTLESAIRIAEEELGLVCPDTIVFTPDND